MSPLNEKTPELQPQAGTWEKIQQQIQPAPELAPWYDIFTKGFYQWATACSLLLVAALSLFSLNQPDSPGALSYVAVLTNEDQQPQLVATTYGDTQVLTLEMLDLPSIDEGETLELWVTSKTDFQARSLGEIPTDVSNFSRALTTAEWRLIKDSDSLLLSIEEAGGSPIGEPMGEIVSRGACIRLSTWQDQA